MPRSHTTELRSGCINTSLEGRGEESQEVTKLKYHSTESFGPFGAPNSQNVALPGWGPFTHRKLSGFLMPSPPQRLSPRVKKGSTVPAGTCCVQEVACQGAPETRPLPRCDLAAKGPMLATRLTSQSLSFCST